MNDSKYYIKIMNENVTYDFDGTIDDCIEAILEEYERHDISMHDLIKFIEIKGLSITDVVKVYAKLFDISNNDIVIHIVDGKEIDLKK